MKPFNPKPIPCKVCGETFTARTSLHRVCSVRCSVKLKKIEQAEERARVKTRRQAMKTLPQLKAEAQREFNAYIRERDRDQPCICCGLPLGTGEVGGAFDCGHYRSVGSAPHLRFDERNAHAQRKVCNRWGAGRAVDYRLGLIRRIGLASVEALESDNEVKKWTREALIEIAATYRAKARELRKERP